MISTSLKVEKSIGIVSWGADTVAAGFDSDLASDAGADLILDSVDGVNVIF